MFLTFPKFSETRLGAKPFLGDHCSCATIWLFPDFIFDFLGELNRLKCTEFGSEGRNVLINCPESPIPSWIGIQCHLQWAFPGPGAKKRGCKGTKTSSDPIFRSWYRVTSPNFSFLCISGECCGILSSSEQIYGYNIEFSDGQPDSVVTSLPLAGVWNWVICKVPPNPRHSMVLWNSSENITCWGEAWQDWKLGAELRGWIPEFKLRFNIKQKKKSAVVTKPGVQDQIRNHAWKSIKSTLNVWIPFLGGIYLFPSYFRCFDPPVLSFSVPFSRQEVSGKDHIKNQPGLTQTGPGVKWKGTSHSSWTRGIAKHLPIQEQNWED